MLKWSSITLTPGTITVGLTEDGRFIVHALDRDIAEGIEDSVFIQMILEQQKLEGGSEKTGGAL